MSTPNSDRERALEVARKSCPCWGDGVDGPRECGDGRECELHHHIADLLLRECAAAHEEGARKMREAAEKFLSDVDNCGRGLDLIAAKRAAHLVAALPLPTASAITPGAKVTNDAGQTVTVESASGAEQPEQYFRMESTHGKSDEQPEPREGDEWSLSFDVLSTRGGLAHFCITTESEEHSIALPLDWLRANGRLVSRKEGGA